MISETAAIMLCMIKKHAILIVDDEAIIVMSLKRELSERFGHDYIIESALNAIDAEKIIEELCDEGIKIILIISDWLMPGIKGDEFLERIQKIHPDIRSILLSGYVDDTALQKLKEKIRLDAFLTKPWSKNELIKAVDRCISLA